VQFLGAGETITLSFDVTVTDDSGALNDSDIQTVTLTITGTNDAPVLADTTDPTAVLEAVDASAQDLSALTGSFSVTDLDVGDTLSASVVGSPTVLLGGNPFTLPAGAAALTAAGAFILNPTSTASTGGAIAIGYSYDPGAANLDFLRAGQSLTITYQVQVGDGLATSAVQGVTFTITGTNDAPVLSGDLAAPINEGGTYQLTTADLNFTDLDDVAANVTFAVAGITNGALYVNGVAGNTFTGAQLAAGLVTFQHDGSETLTAGFQVSVEDGNQDLSAPVAQAFNFTGTPVNDAPVNGVPGAQSVNEDNSLVFSTANGNPISISDADAGVGTVRVTLSVANGTLTLGSLAGLTFIAGADGSGSFTIEGTQAAINTALQGLIYQGNLNYFGPDSISIVTSDLGNSGSGGALTDSDSVAITVNAVNDAPVASPVTLAAIAEDSGARLITQAELLAGVTDVDGPPATITALSVATGSGMLMSNGNGTWTYMPALNDDTSVTFNYTASDVSLSSSSTATLDITPVNDAPVNTVAGGQSINAGTSLVFSSGTSNAISISDVDAGSNTVQATLSVTNGTLTLGSTTGLIITSGANGSSSVTVQGTQAAINAALQGLAYLANLSFSGSDTLSIITSDLGNSGAGGTLTDTDSIAITVNAVRAAPTDIRLTMTSPLLDPNNLNISIQGTLTATDPDPGAFTFTFSGGGTTLANSGTNFQISGATFSSTSNIGQNTTYILPIVVTQAGDGILSWTETFSIITGSNNGADPLTGNATGDDILYGGGGAETIMALGGDDTIFGHQEGDLLLSGGAGRDTIYGGNGNDTLNGGADADIFVFNIAANNSSNHDTIQDFEANGVDLIHLDNAVFTQLTATGTLSSANFASNAGGTATDGNDYIMFDTTTGNLYYDPDGNGGTARLLIATLAVTAGTIDPTDILII
jgi:VCBS repeat-containing protein